MKLLFQYFQTTFCFSSFYKWNLEILSSFNFCHFWEWTCNCSDQTQTLKKGGPTHLDLEGGDSLKNQEGLANLWLLLQLMTMTTNTSTITTHCHYFYHYHHHCHHYHWHYHYLYHNHYNYHYHYQILLSDRLPKQARWVYPILSAWDFPLCPTEWIILFWLQIKFTFLRTITLFWSIKTQKRTLPISSHVSRSLASSAS